jgi:hypothetical protein
MTDCSSCRALRLASGCSCLSLAMRLSRFLCANPPTRIPSICPGAHMGNAQIAPLGSCPWGQISRQAKPPGPPVTHLQLNWPIGSRLNQSIIPTRFSPTAHGLHGDGIRHTCSLQLIGVAKADLPYVPCLVSQFCIDALNKSAPIGWAVDLFLPNLGSGRLVQH